MEDRGIRKAIHSYNSHDACEALTFHIVVKHLHEIRKMLRDVCGAEMININIEAGNKIFSYEQYDVYNAMYCNMLVSVSHRFSDDSENSRFSEFLRVMNRMITIMDQIDTFHLNSKSENPALFRAADIIRERIEIVRQFIVDCGDTNDKKLTDKFVNTMIQMAPHLVDYGEFEDDVIQNDDFVVNYETPQTDNLSASEGIDIRT
jgi:hypothetical protein